MSAWISVGHHGLPEDAGHYLSIVVTDGAVEAHVLGFHREYGWWFCADVQRLDETDSKVSHWMPLPPDPSEHAEALKAWSGNMRLPSG